MTAHVKSKVQDKTNSLLINYAGYPYTISSFMLDNGLALLAATLRQHGHTTYILDYSTVEMVRKLRPRFLRKWLLYIWENIMDDSVHIGWFTRLNLYIMNVILKYFQKRVAEEIYREIKQYIHTKTVDFIGFKLWNGDGMETSEWIAKKLKKEFPDIVLVGGGPQVDSFLDYIEYFTDVFDILVYGEGDQSIIQIAEYVSGKRELHAIPNILYRDNGMIKRTPLKRAEDIDVLAPGDYSVETYPSMEGDRKLKVITVEESRGCQNRCAFCLHPIKSGDSIRIKNVEVLLNEFEEYIKKYGIDVFQFAGSNPPYSLFDKLCKEVKKRNVQFEYSTMVSIKIKDKEIFKKMKQSGAYSVLFGCESGSDRILQKMRKVHTTAMIKETLRLAKKAGLYVAASFIYPAPFDNRETFEESLAFIKNLTFDAVTGTWGLVIPGTDWANHPEKYCIEPLLSDKKEWVKKIFRWKVAAAYPPALQLPLPYKLNGLTSRECALEHECFFNRIKQMGFLTTIGSAEALAAKRMGIEPKTMQDIVLKALFVGDTETLQQLVIKHNRSHLKQ